MITAVAVSLSGVVFAGRIAYRLSRRAGSERDGAARIGAAAGSRAVAAWVAAVALLGDPRDYWHYILSAQSDPMIVALCLGAIDCHLSGRHAVGVRARRLASLGRPGGVAVPRPVRDLGVARDPLDAALHRRRDRAAARAVVRDPGADLAQPVRRRDERARVRAARRTTTRCSATISRFLDLQPAALVRVGAAVGGVGARGDASEPCSLLAAGIVALGRASRSRSRCTAGRPPAVHVRGGRGARGARRRRRRVADLASPYGGRPPPDGPAWRSAVVVCAVLVPTAVSAARTEHKDLTAQRARTVQINAPASGAIGRRGRGAWSARAASRSPGSSTRRSSRGTLRVNVGHVGFKYGPAIHASRPIVLFTPAHGRWKIQALHQPHGACRRLPT